MNSIPFQVDHDLHIHSQLSSCSADPEQTTARILQYAEENNLTDICLTDHYWDEDVPFNKIGIAHLTCGLMSGKCPFTHADILRLISDDTMRELFTLAAKRGVGIELNFSMSKNDEAALTEMLRVYQRAKECDCKFYLGSDAHHVSNLLAAPDNFRKIVEWLELTEADKFSFH